MLTRVGMVLQDPEKRAILSFLGGGAVIIAGGLWTVGTYIARIGEPHDNKVTVVYVVDRRAAAELTAQLTAIRSAPVGPGEQAAVGEAVRSITQRANEGDGRLQRAFGLLKQNKIEAAIEILNAVAGSQEARAEQAPRQSKDQKEAAAAFRDLGAIAGLRDPKKALEAYAKAVAFDPDDKESLYWDGRLSLLAGRLPAAEQSLSRLLRLSSLTGDQRGVYRANLRLGELALQRGDLTQSLEHEVKARRIALDQAAANPGDVDRLRDLSVGHEKVGAAQEALGDRAGALESYSESLAIAAGLAKSAPADAERQRDLSVACENVGGVQEVLGDRAGALKSYRDSLAIRERLANSDPGNAEWQRDLAIAYNRVGGVQQALGDSASALKSFSSSLAIARRLVKSDPGNAEWQRDLAVTISGLTMAHMHLGANEKAADYLRQGQAIMERLTKLSPENAQWRQDLAWFSAKPAELKQEEPPLEMDRHARPPSDAEETVLHGGDGNENRAGEVLSSGQRPRQKAAQPLTPRQLGRGAEPQARPAARFASRRSASGKWNSCRSYGALRAMHGHRHFLPAMAANFSVGSLDSRRLATICRPQLGRNACKFEREAASSNISGQGAERPRPKSLKDFRFGRPSRMSSIFAASLTPESGAFIVPNIQRPSRFGLGAP
jgi:tetratricopeptide (TPR) repeat protein